MRQNYKRIGDYIQLVDERNRNLEVTTLLGLSISKVFIPSVANIIGTDMENYKIIRKNQFACSTMQVRRDSKMPVALLKDFEEAIISPAYPIFEVIDNNVLLPEYLMMWFSRSEFDREACFYAVGGVRGSLEWDDFLDMQLPVPSPEKQRQLVNEYRVLVDRITINNRLIQKLEETAQAVYKEWFVDFEFPDANGKPYKSNGGEMIWCEKLGKYIPKGWVTKQLDETGNVVDSLHKTPNYSSKGFPMIRVTDINAGFLDLSNTMLVEPKVFNEFSKNHKSKKGDIVVSRVGATFGEFSYAHTDEKFCLGQNTAVIVPTLLDSALMYTILTSSDVRNQIEKKVVGSAYSTLSLKDIRELNITLPNIDIGTTIDAIANLLNALFDNRSLYCQETSSLIKIQYLLLSKLATIEN